MSTKLGSNRRTIQYGNSKLDDNMIGGKAVIVIRNSVAKVSGTEHREAVQD